jgi:dipeptidase E
MRLFLSSQDLGKYAHVAAELAGNNKKLALIRNAGDDKPDERNFTTPEKKEMFEAVGFTFEEIDLRDYFGKQAELKEKLSTFGALFSSGGNTFILRRAMKASGLDEILIELLHEDKILYGGWSAGAIIMTPSLRGADIGDRPSPDVVPAEYPIKETVWEGLGMVPYMIVPHTNMEWFKDDAAKSIAYYKSHDLPYKALKDGQVIVVNGSKSEFLE